MRSLTSRLVATLVAGASVLALAACSGSASGTSATAPPPYTVVTPATIRPGDAVPRPSGHTVLTLRGVPTTNVGRTLQFDLATLDRLGTVEYTVFDRQAEGHDVSFSGPLVRTLLAVAGVTSGTLHCLALNDYAVDVPVSDATRYPLLLATRADGQRMSVAHYGPTRLIYPTRGNHLDKAVYDPRWIWQLSEIQVH